MSNYRVKDLNASQAHSAYRLAVSVLSEGCKSSDHHNIQYRNGYLLVEPINGDPHVISLRNRHVWILESKLHSGTDLLRQRVMAEYFFNSCADKKGDPFYLFPSEVPRSLSLEELPIHVGIFRIKRNLEFVDARNPISGHQWREPGNPVNSCNIEGPGAYVSSKFRSVKSAVGEVSYLLKYGRGSEEVPSSDLVKGIDEPLPLQNRPRMGAGQ